MNTNLKIYALILISTAVVACASVFLALPRIKAIFAESITLNLPPQLAGAAIKSLDREYLVLSALILILAAVLLAAAIWLAAKVLRPVDNFITKVSVRLYPVGKGSLEEISAGIDSLCGSASVLDRAPIGMMVVNSDGMVTLFNREAGEITELSSASVIGRPMNQFFPNNYYNYTMEVLKTGREYLGLRNIIKAGGFFKELLLSISPLREEERITGAVVVFQDVTPQRKMIEVQTAYTLARDLATQKDLEGTVRVIAGAAAEMSGVEGTAVFLADPGDRLVIRASHGIPRQAVDQYNSAPLCLNSPKIKDLYCNRVPLLHGDVRKNAGLKPLLVLPETASFYSFPIFHLDNLAGLLNLYSCQKNRLSKDVIYLIQSMSRQVNTAITNFFELQRMRALASADGITGLLNKRRFLEVLDSHIAEAAGGGTPLTLAMIDIDHFKKVNDTYGHQSGDQILREIASLISGRLRETDQAFRYGGEEFSVIMPGTPLNSALEAIDRIRTAIEDAVFNVAENTPVRVTVSAGLASFPGEAAAPEDLILYADTALYAAKRSGRNRVMGYEPGQSITG